MKQVTVGASSVKIASAGNRDFVAIYNNDTQPIFLCFDGDATALTTANGFPVAAASWLSLNNDQLRNVQNHDVFAISQSGAADVRLQGVS